MRYTFLGSTGLRVSELCLGAMTFGTDWGWGADEATSRAMFDAFVEAGGTFIDTANAYTNGTSERYVGRFVQGRRDRFVVATKYTISTDPSDPNADGNGRKNLMRSLEASLRRLATDHVDVYWVHMWDGFTPIDETVRALDDAVRAGKVLHVGFSDFPAWLVARADLYAEMARLTRPAAIQVEYNLAQRDAERDLLPMAESLGLSVCDWSPLAGGALTGKRVTPADGSGADVADGRVASGAVGHFDKYRSERAMRIAQAVVDAARELECTPAQLAIAWLRHRTPAHIPIVGARTVAQLADNLRAVDVVIPAEVARRLDAASAIPLGFPHDFYRSGWRHWFGPHVDRLDPRLRPVGRSALGLDAPGAG
ncbi:MAG: aldo/keto reductase [Gemmatimonadaceae bacterium]|jgi:aryl-alcohol dehydrogenase-like predicted oxidoreductase|nr:aldo/keto reductase [Gemmatimonadaceae bacterium]